jgi:hypothetical protein
MQLVRHCLAWGRFASEDDVDGPYVNIWAANWANISWANINGSPVQSRTRPLCGDPLSLKTRPTQQRMRIKVTPFNVHSVCRPTRIVIVAGKQYDDSFLFFSLLMTWYDVTDSKPAT